MPVSLETAKEVVYWTEGIARQADRAKEQSCSKYRPSGQPAVVVTGANGQLGRPLVERLIREGERVRLFVRRLPSDDSVNHPQAEVVVGDLGDPAAVDDVVRGATTVFHLGAAMTGAWADHEAGTIAGTRNVVEACLRHRVARLIYISSLSVLRLAGHPNTEPVTESSPVESAPQLRGYYTQAKLEAERIVLSAINKDKLAAVILRPGQIWSEKGSLLSATIGLRFGRWLVMIGDGSILLPLVSVGDVVEAMILASRSDVAKGQIYHVIDDDVLSRDELLPLYIMAREPHLRKLRLPLSSAIWLAKPIEMIARILRRAPPISPYRIRSAVSKVHFDCSKVRSQLGWRPRTPSAEALRSLLKLRKG
jgi:nucleoside-diphosphate-sugar epimerase